MTSLRLHEVHAALGARFAELSGMEIVADYGDSPAEHAALRSAVGVVDLGFRGRLCLTGAGRLDFDDWEDFMRETGLLQTDPLCAHAERIVAMNCSRARPFRRSWCGLSTR